jgi:putative flippase GtrA
MKSSLPNHVREPALFALNGLAATGVHYGVLHAGVELLAIYPVGLANFIAAGFGITASFLGNRHVVFRDRANGPLLHHLARFGLLYGVLALASAAVLFLWTDIGGQDYRLGFLLATGLQVVLSYFGNRHLVFTQ